MAIRHGVFPSGRENAAAPWVPVPARTARDSAWGLPVPVQTAGRTGGGGGGSLPLPGSGMQDESGAAVTDEAGSGLS